MAKSFTSSLAICLLAILCSFSIVKAQESEPLDPQIEQLIGQMTLDEKLGQMTLFTTDWESTGPSIRGGYENDIRTGRCGALFNSHTVAFTTRLQKIAVEESRLKIPLLFGYDVIHGYKTMFPIPLGEAASWDMQAIEKSAFIMSKEAAAAGLHWTYAPMVDITREPRWGRVMEGAGEDTYLGSVIARARVMGIQGEGFDNADRLVSCVKHFAAYGAPMAGRDYNTVDMSERYFREVYLPPYKAALEAGALTVMTSFNEYDGVPATGSSYLLTDLLRGELNFKGFIVSDYTSINEMVNHGVAENDTEAGILAVNAGVDMDMQGATFQELIKKGIQDGRISIERINESVRRILMLKKKLGLFENPFKFSDSDREKATILSKEHLEASRDVARKSVVLLKNNKVLPVDSKVRRILVVGPLGDDQQNLIGAWSGSGEGRHCVSLLQGLKQHPAAGKMTIDFVKGCDIEGKEKSNFAGALAKAKAADLIILAIGEHKDMSGEAAARAMIRIPGEQEQLLSYLKQSGKPIVTIVMNGRPLVLTEVHEQSDAVLEAWWLGTEAGNALADIIFGTYNPSGKLPISFPRHEGQIPVFYSQKNTGRPFQADSKWNSKYMDLSNKPLYAFGYGLSYTTFNYSKPVVNKTEFSNEDKIRVSVTVENNGIYDGEEVVQLYVRDLVGSVTRPVKELKGFQKVFISKGTSKKIEFILDKETFSYYRQDMSWGAEPGKFHIFIGPDSDTDNKVEVILKK